MNCIWSWRTFVNRIFIAIMSTASEVIVGKQAMALEKSNASAFCTFKKVLIYPHFFQEVYVTPKNVQDTNIFPALLEIFWAFLLCPNVPINAVEVPIATPLAIVISLLKAVVSASTQQTKLLAFPFREESFCILHGYNLIVVDSNWDVFREKM